MSDKELKNLMIVTSTMIENLFSYNAPIETIKAAIIEEKNEIQFGIITRLISFLNKLEIDALNKCDSTKSYPDSTIYDIVKEEYLILRQRIQDLKPEILSILFKIKN